MVAVAGTRLIGYTPYRRRVKRGTRRSRLPDLRRVVGLDQRQRDDRMLHRERGRLQPRVHLELRQDPLDVRSNGVAADAETFGDGGSRGSSDEELEHLALAARELFGHQRDVSSS